MEQKIIGLNIKYFRKAQGLTQKELAEKIGVSWEMISRYETGKSSPLDRIHQIAEALKTPLPRLLTASAVTDTTSAYHINSVPLIQEKFSNIQHAIDETKQYYVAPDWIRASFTHVCAIEGTLINPINSNIDNSGVFFLTTEPTSSSKDLILAEREAELIINAKTGILSSDRFLATVVAWEKRFK